MKYLLKLALSALVVSIPAFAQQQTLSVTPTVTNGVAHYTVASRDGSTFDLAVPLAGTFTYTPPPVTPPPPPPTAGPAIPGNATQVILDPLSWKCEHDAGTPGTGTCKLLYPVAVDTAHPLSRGYEMDYSGKGGVRWSTTAANDLTATHFVYDTWVNVADPKQVANLELDINQVTAAGKTRILGTQCSSYSHSWEYTLNDASTGRWHWVPSNIACDPTKWTANTWKHIQIAGHFDAADNAYYEGVWVDGAYTAFANASGATGRALGWATGHVVINFQIDGTASSAASATVYANKLTIYRW